MAGHVVRSCSFVMAGLSVYYITRLIVYTFPSESRSEAPVHVPCTHLAVFSVPLWRLYFSASLVIL